MYGIQFPTDAMKDQFLSSVISMVAPTWCHGPTWGNPFGRMLTELTSEFTHFNVVIRLSKGNIHPFFRVSPRRCRLLNSGPLYWAINFFLAAMLTAAKPPFSSVAQVLATAATHVRRQQACPLPAGMVSLVSGEVNQLCTQFVKIWKPLHAPRGWPTTFP